MKIVSLRCSRKKALNDNRFSRKKKRLLRLSLLCEILKFCDNRYMGAHPRLQDHLGAVKANLGAIETHSRATRGLTLEP
jgi:hypothetical protein